MEVEVASTGRELSASDALVMEPPNSLQQAFNQTSELRRAFHSGGHHDSSVDLWSIGYLIRCYEEHADQQLSGLMDHLLGPANDRTSDDEACFFLGIE